MTAAEMKARRLARRTRSEQRRKARDIKAQGGVFGFAFAVIVGFLSPIAH